MGDKRIEKKKKITQKNSLDRDVQTYVLISIIARADGDGYDTFGSYS